MTLLFTYGSLKQGFSNQKVNTGVRPPGTYRTRDRLPMYLLGDGRVPCLVHARGDGHQVVGEVYRVDAQCLAAIDLLERVGEPGGYLRIEVELQRTDDGPATVISASVYVKLPEHVPETTARMGPLDEYKAEHALGFIW